MGPLEMPAHFLTMFRICYPYNDTCMRLFDNIGVISCPVFPRMVEILLKRFWNAFSWYNIFCIWFKSSHIVFASQEAMWYWPNSQFPQCTCSISHNATFRTEMFTFPFLIMHCGIWNRYIVGFVTALLESTFVQYSSSIPSNNMEYIYVDSYLILFVVKVFTANRMAMRHIFIVIDSNSILLWHDTMMID